MFTVTESLRAELLKPAFDLRLGFVAGSTTLDQSRIHTYELRERGRYGEATLTLDIDNADGSLTNLAQLQPFAPAIFSEGAFIHGTAVIVSRHTWRIVSVKESTEPNTRAHLIRIICTNAHALLSNSPSANKTYASQTIQSIADELITDAGLNPAFDSNDLWSALVDFTRDSEASYLSNLRALVESNLGCVARFDGLDMFLSIPAVSPTAVAAIGTNGDAIPTDTAHHTLHDIDTRVYIVGMSGQVAGAITDLPKTTTASAA